MFALMPETGTTTRPTRSTRGDLKGDVRFEDVGFNYPDGTHVLHDITLRGDARRDGRARRPDRRRQDDARQPDPALLRRHAGRVLVDGVDVRRYRVRSLREQIAIVLQDPVLFSGTIADNLRYGRLDATDEEIEEAARAAHAHEFIARLPKGYDTEIAEAGGGLSGGERQRLSVARAILKNAPILDPRRADVVARRHLGGDRVRRAAPAAGRAHDDRHRAPAVDRPRRRSHPGARRRAGSPRRAATTSC